MVMTFTTPEARAAHPQASLISQDNWSRYFKPYIYREFLEIMSQPTLIQAIELIKLLPDASPWIDERQLIRMIVCLRASFPDIEPHVIFSKMLEICGYTHEDLFIAFCGAGIQVSKSLPLLEEIMPMINTSFAGSRVLSSCLQEACKFGQAEIGLWVYSLATTPEQQAEMLQDKDYRAFFCACLYGHFDTARWIYSLATTAKQRGAMLQARYDDDDRSVFCCACIEGHLQTAQWLYSLATTAEQRMTMLQAGLRDNDYYAFYCACSRGHLETAQWLYSLATTTEQRAAMLEPSGYSGFSVACAGGHLETAQWRYSLPTTAEQRAAMLASSDYCAFGHACAGGHLETAQWLYSLPTTAEQRAAMLASSDYCAFGRACAGGHLETAQWLYEVVILEHRAAMLHASDCYAFRYAGYPTAFPETARWLLSLSPTLLAYAEAHNREYEHLVYPFVDQFIETLHQRQQAQQTAHPDSIFDLEDEQETLFGFYSMRNLIRRNDPTLMEHIHYLLMLPRLRSILHLGVNGGEENECLRLALHIGNRAAVGVLMQIETVRTQALTQNLYQEEQRVHGGLSLAEIARDRESSMRALNSAEKAIIERIQKHYAAAVESEGGVHAVFEAFKQYLRGQYVVVPAYQMFEGTKIPLPFEYADFEVYLESNRLTRKQVRLAYQAYYRHPVHTAYRYVSKPNYWMHENAGYVYINDERTQRWSTFEEYVSTIAYFWMAAKDEEMPAIEGYTLEGRKALFVKELALIGRAHNWDKTQAVLNALGEPTAELEHYDDLEGDRPSCFSGVNRRLFQSVLGHALFVGLTREVLELELVEFVQEKVRHVLSGQSGEFARNAQELYDALRTFCEDGVIAGEIPSTLLLSFNLSDEEIAVFKLRLSEKWEVSLASNLAFDTLIDETLRMDSNEALIVHFATRANLFDMLAGMARTERSLGAQRHGFFARVDRAGSADAQGAAAMEITGDADESQGPYSREPSTAGFRFMG